MHKVLFIYFIDQVFVCFTIQVSKHTLFYVYKISNKNYQLVIFTILVVLVLNRIMYFAKNRSSL